eukprot:TRINITY_DN80381_c0_g1_i1.p1 TRINITY_DN80381_c0_g1~~TRINITY_DN80381_c0_g1_i1.p1  ORF type:complete len:277 (-),score=21.95 TRINITY_DN80381_c0_g1_i1:87-917(-)
MRWCILVCACAGVVLMCVVGVPLAWDSAARTEAIASAMSAAGTMTIVGAIVGAFCFTDWSSYDYVKVTTYVDDVETGSHIEKDYNCLGKLLANFLIPGVCPFGSVTFAVVFPLVYFAKAVVKHEHQGIPLRPAVSAYFVGSLVGCVLCTAVEGFCFGSGRLAELASSKYERPDRHILGIIITSPFVGLGYANWLGMIFFLVVATFGSVPFVLGLLAGGWFFWKHRQRKKRVTDDDVMVVQAAPDNSAPVNVQPIQPPNNNVVPFTNPLQPRNDSSV